MIDRRSWRRRCDETIRNKGLHRHANSQDKNSASQGRGVIVRSAAVLVLLARIAVVALAIVAVNVGHAFAVCRDLPVLVGMNALRDGQHKRAGKPQRSWITRAEHCHHARCSLPLVKQRPSLSAPAASEKHGRMLHSD